MQIQDLKNYWLSGSFILLNGIAKLLAIIITIYLCVEIEPL